MININWYAERILDLPRVAMATLAIPALAQNRFCIGTQTAGGRAAVQNLGAAGDKYQPQVRAIERLQNDATAATKPIEDQWKNIVTRQVAALRAANPRASDSFIRWQLETWVRGSAEADAMQARLLVACSIRARVL